MNFNKRIEELNTNLVLKETIIIMLIDDLKNSATKTDSNSCKKFKFLLDEIQHNKNEYNTTYIQLQTLTSYQSGVKT